MEQNKETVNKETKSANTWDFLGKFLTFAIVAIYLLYIINNIFNILPVGSIWIDIINYLTYYGPMALVIITSLEVAGGKKGLIRTLLIICWLFIVLFSISPNLFGLIK